MGYNIKNELIDGVTVTSHLSSAMCPTKVVEWHLWRFPLFATLRRHQVEVRPWTSALPGILGNNVGLVLDVLAGAVVGLPTNVISDVRAWASLPKHIEILTDGSNWMALSHDHIVNICIEMCMHEGEQDTLKNKVIEWCRQESSTALDTLTRLKRFCKNYADGIATANDSSSVARKLLTDLSTRCLQVYDDEAWPVVEAIFTQNPGDTFGVSERMNEIGDAADKTVSGKKRCREDAGEELSAMMDSAAQWASFRVKRLCASENWVAAQPNAVVAMLRACLSNRGADTACASDVLQAAIQSWASQAALGSVMKVVRDCSGQIDANVADLLWVAVTEKVETLESHCRALGGDGLHAALAAQRKAEAAQRKAEAEVVAERSRAAAVEAQAAREQAEYAQGRKWIKHATQRLSELLRISPDSADVVDAE